MYNYLALVLCSGLSASLGSLNLIMGQILPLLILMETQAKQISLNQVVWLIKFELWDEEEEGVVWSHKDVKRTVQQALTFIPQVQPNKLNCRDTRRQHGRSSPLLLINYVLYPSLPLYAHTHLLAHPHSNYSFLCSLRYPGNSYQNSTHVS